MNAEKRYPTFFIHGYLGWGSKDKLDKRIHYWGAGKDLLGHLRKKGFEVYAPSLGPFNSAWDRSCELYAQIYGGTVDYGKAHSEKFGHERYGRTYPGIMNDWGKPGNHEKINLIGHSFGGPTVNMFSELIANGSEEERRCTSKEELSGLFEGGHSAFIKSVTTLAGVNNGTSFDSLMGNVVLKCTEYTILFWAVVLGNTRLMNVYDFHLDHWNLMKDPKKVKVHILRWPLHQWRNIFRFTQNHVDNIGFEMSIETMSAMNANMHTSNDIYYFARRGCRTHKTLLGNQSPDLKMNFACWNAAWMTGHYRGRRLKEYGFDKSWLPNDGFVNVTGQSAPLCASYEEWEDRTAAAPEKGKWYNMPVEYKDHVSWNGIRERKDEYFAYYDEMMEFIDNL